MSGTGRYVMWPGVCVCVCVCCIQATKEGITSLDANTGKFGVRHNLVSVDIHEQPDAGMYLYYSRKVCKG